MLKNIITRVVGSRNDRLIRRMHKTVVQINDLEPGMQALSDEALGAKTAEFRERHEQGETLEQLLPEAFAAVREAARRTIGLRHYDVQMIGGMVLHNGQIAEMKTGEGKTLVATLAVYLNALPGNGVHVVTVNDYLARRDAEWMGPVYEALDLAVGVSVPGMTPAAKRVAYAADVTYGTNNEFGFDYLRDNMAFSLEQKAQRGQPFAIVDEVDSILIDEARTPLIISGPADEGPELYVRINRIVPKLTKQESDDAPGDFTIDEKSKQVYLSEDGMARVEELLTAEGLLKADDSLYHAHNLSLVHTLNAALRAHYLYHKDVEYIVNEGEIVIVDEFTGRTMPGRRWSEGLHQAVEAKEGVPIQRENQTLASITFQNYFRLYGKLSGMTGTADTEAYEFQSIYGLEVVVIPTHKPMIRQDNADLVFLSGMEKFNAVIEDIEDCVNRGQPVLVGTTSIETSELLSGLLNKKGIKHEVLNAKQHEREAQIVAQAGRSGAVTIATNMAGRGTDIVLGGNLEAELAALPEDVGDDQKARVREEWQERHDQVLAAGGLHIIGTERHESRRIDNQLRGRSGRQGDPGSSRFYLSLEDNLMRIFASERLGSMMQKLGMKEGEAIEHPWVTKAIENAQRKVESHNFDIRKHLLDFDDVANDQRRVIYTERNELMENEDIGEAVAELRHEVLNGFIDRFVPPDSVDEQWDVEGLEKSLEGEFGIEVPVSSWVEEDDTVNEASLRERILAEVEEHFSAKEKLTGSDVMRHFEKALMLNVLDQHWKEHLASMDYLRRGINLRAYGQKKPINEYKQEAFAMFGEMLDNINHDTIRMLARVRVRSEEDVDAVGEQRKTDAPMQFQHAAVSGPLAGQQAGQQAARPQPPQPGHQIASGEQPFVREGRKVGRNEPCPCGSGKKYKHCHGRIS